VTGRLPVPLRRFHPGGAPARRRLRRRLHRSVAGRTVLVVGPRRAGNHAVIAWLANALAGTEVELTYPEWRVGITADAEVLHCNDLPRERGSLRYGDFDLAVRRALGGRGAGDLVVSYEDVRIADLVGPVLLASDPDARVLVTRPLLDLVASRIGRSQGGPDRSDPVGMYDVTQAWLDVELTNRTARPPGWVEVPFDRWLTDPAVRNGALDQLGLEVDLMPSGISSHGGGSTFAGHTRVPDAADLLARRERVDWDAPTVALLLAARNRPLLRDDEVAFLEARSAG